MANNYVQYSFDLNLPKGKERQAENLIKELFSFIERPSTDASGDIDVDSFVSDFSRKLMTFNQSETFYNKTVFDQLSLYFIDGAYESIGFEYCFYSDTVVFYTEDDGNFDLAAVMASNLMHFGLVRDLFRLATCAYTCSKPMVDGFGGDMVLITPDKLIYGPSDNKFVNTEIDKLHKEIHSLSVLFDYLEENDLGFVSRMQEKIVNVDGVAHDLYLLQVRINPCYILWNPGSGKFDIVDCPAVIAPEGEQWMFDLGKHNVNIPVDDDFPGLFDAFSHGHFTVTQSQKP